MRWDRVMFNLFLITSFALSACAEPQWQTQSCGELIISEPVACVCPTSPQKLHEKERTPWSEIQTSSCSNFPTMATFCESLKFQVTPQIAANDLPPKNKSPTLPPSVSESTCIDINHASVQELMKLPGIGKSRAEDIVSARQKKPFKRRSDLKRIHGIGKKTYQKLEKSICRIESSHRG